MTSIAFHSTEPVIGIDASRLSVHQRTGTETYTWELLHAMARQSPGEPIRLYFNAEQLPSRAMLPWQKSPIPFSRLWTHLRLSWEMAQCPPALLWVPAHVVPLNHPRTVVTIHDLGYLHFPGGHAARQRRMLDVTTRWSAHAAAHIIAISETTKRDLVERYHVPEQRVTVIPHGVSDRFQIQEQNEVDRVRRDYGLSEPFVLAVGTVQPRKNYDGLARSMAAFARAGLPHKLIVAGKDGWLAEDVKSAIRTSGFADRVRLLDYVPLADLPALYGAAEVVAFPSWYEGFGLPAIEAMRCGAPVVASNRGSLPEVAGDAALVIDPADENAFGEALLQVASDRTLRDDMIDRGIVHSAAFTWDRAASMTLELLRRECPG